MYIYFSSLIISLLLFRYINISKRSLSFKLGALKTNRFYIDLNPLFVSLPFVLVAILRKNVGTDYYTYTKLYAEIVPIDIYEVEPLFEALIKFSVNVLDSPHFIVAATGVFVCVFMFSSIYKYSDNISFSIILFLLTGTFNWSLNIMRQALATMIFIYCVEFIEKKDLKRYLFLIIIAILIHKSAVIYIPIYFAITYLNLDKFKTVFFIIFAFAITPFARNILIEISDFLNLYHGYFNNIYDNKKFSYMLFFVNLFALVIMLNLKPTFQNKIIYNLQFLSVIFSCWIPIIPNGERIVYMFSPIQIIGVSNAISNFKKRETRICLYLVTFFSYLFFFYYYFYYKNYGETFPYNFIWDV